MNNYDLEIEKYYHPENFEPLEDDETFETLEDYEKDYLNNQDET